MGPINPNKQSTHLVVQDGRFVALVCELVTGQYVIMRPGDPVYADKDAAVAAALGHDLSVASNGHNPENNEDFMYQ